MIPLAESDVVKQSCDWLRWHGWLVVNNPSGLLARPGSTARMRVGEVGAADKIVMRPVESGLCRLFFLEFKSTAAAVKLKPKQIAWAERMRESGYLCAAVSSVEELERWVEVNFP